MSTGELENGPAMADKLVCWLFGLFVYPAFFVILALHLQEESTLNKIKADAQRPARGVTCPVMNGKVAWNIVVENGKTFCGGYR